MYLLCGNILKKNEWEVITLKSIENALYYINNAMKELAQCGAVLMKMQNTIVGEVKE